MSNELSDVYAVYDSREKSPKRIEVFRDFIESNGGAVERGCLELCDYRLSGIFRNKDIDIAIEYKTLVDFSSSYQDLSDKLARSFELYTDVGLFVEIPQFRTTSEDNFHAFILNDAVPDGSANVLQYAVLQNSLASWQQSGVHVRQLQSEVMWGYAIASVLISVTKDTHRGLEITKTKDFKSQYLNILTKFDGIGQKTAQKVIKSFPNLYWLCTYSEDDLKDALGKVTGKKLYDFIHNNALITSEWENKGSKSQLSKETEKVIKSNPEQSISNPELKYLDENKPKFIEVPKGCYLCGDQVRDINPQRDYESEILQSQSAKEVIGANTPGKAQCAPDTSTEHKAPESGKVADLSGSDLGTELQLSDDGKGNRDESKEENKRTATGNPPLDEREPIDKPHSARHAITDDQPKAILNSTYPNPPPSAASSICEPPDNSEFQSNPYLRDIENFIRKDGKSLDEIGKEFGLSEMMALKGVNELMKKHRVWFCKADKKIYFGLDKNHVPVVADKEMDVGV